MKCPCVRARMCYNTTCKSVKSFNCLLLQFINWPQTCIDITQCGLHVRTHAYTNCSRGTRREKCRRTCSKADVGNRSVLYANLQREWPGNYLTRFDGVIKWFRNQNEIEFSRGRKITRIIVTRSMKSRVNVWIVCESSSVWSERVWRTSVGCNTDFNLFYRRIHDHAPAFWTCTPVGS